MQFKPAERKNTIPIIGLYGLSGCGKTMSALLLARGLVGERGKVGLIDTETGRGQLYADVIPGGYNTLELSDPFTPQRYIEAIDAAISAGLDCLIIDSGSHEWEGLGGVLDMARQNEENTGKAGLHNWKEPKLQHNRFVMKLLQAPFPVIVCLRAKYKSRQVKNGGKNEVVRDDHATPLQAEDFIFELTAHAEVKADHTIHLTKCSHPQLRECFPTDKPISTETGAAIAQWAKGGAAASAEDLLPKAREAAKGGRDGLRAFWKGLSRAEREALKPHTDELSQAADAVDPPAGVPVHGPDGDVVEHAETDAERQHALVTAVSSHPARVEEIVRVNGLDAGTGDWLRSVAAEAQEQRSQAAPVQESLT